MATTAQKLIVEYEQVETIYLSLDDARFKYDEDRESYALTPEQAAEIRDGIIKAIG